MAWFKAHSKKRWFWLLAGILILLGIGMVAGWVLNTLIVGDAPPGFSVLRASAGEYKLVDPLLLIQVPESESFPQYTNLNQDITNYANTAIAQRSVTDVSVYFRDMNSNHWVGYNLDEKFSPASMLKVVTLISVLHASEGFPQLLSGDITISPSVDPGVDSQDYYPPANPIQAGNTYSIQELLTNLIDESDNNANDVLTKYVGSTEIQNTYANLQLPVPTSATTDAYTAQQYSRLFRVLYNGTYLTPDLSEEALDILSRTSFTEGLVAGVPAGTVVAHKFGERTILSSTTTPSVITSPHELHDCGIVYYPNHPYFLCVMTRGADFPTLASTIASISKLVWTDVSKLYAN
jgi:beta-lactamase class A